MLFKPHVFDGLSTKQASSFVFCVVFYGLCVLPKLSTRLTAHLFFKIFQCVFILIVLISVDYVSMPLHNIQVNMCGGGVVCCVCGLLRVFCSALRVDSF